MAHNGPKCRNDLSYASSPLILIRRADSENQIYSPIVVWKMTVGCLVGEVDDFRFIEVDVKKLKHSIEHQTNSPWKEPCMSSC